MKASTKSATPAKKSEDLEARNAEKVTGGLSLNFTKVEYKYLPQ